MHNLINLVFFSIFFKGIDSDQKMAKTKVVQKNAIGVVCRARVYEKANAEAAAHYCSLE